SMDSLTMKVVALHFAKHRRLPTWLDGFGPLGEPIPVPHHSKFRARHAATGLILTGTPDELYRRPDRTIFILDDKTAKFTGTQDALLPMYRVQISGYAWIAERVGLGHASGGGLVYYEPVTELTDIDLPGVIVLG